MGWKESRCEGANVIVDCEASLFPPLGWRLRKPLGLKEVSDLLNMAREARRFGLLCYSQCVCCEVKRGRLYLLFLVDSHRRPGNQVLTRRTVASLCLRLPFGANSVVIQHYAYEEGVDGGCRRWVRAGWRGFLSFTTEEGTKRTHSHEP